MFTCVNEQIFSNSLSQGSSKRCYPSNADHFPIVTMFTHGKKKLQISKFIIRYYSNIFPSFSLAESPPRDLQITAYKLDVANEQPIKTNTNWQLKKQSHVLCMLLFCSQVFKTSLIKVEERPARIRSKVS